MMWTVSRGACTSEEAVAQDNGSNRGDTLLRGVCSLRCSCFDCVRCFALQVRQNKIGRAHAPCVFRGCFGHLHAASASWLFGSHQCLVQRFFSCVQPLRPASTVVGRCVSVLAQVCACATQTYSWHARARRAVAGGARMFPRILPPSRRFPGGSLCYLCCKVRSNKLCPKRSVLVCFHCWRAIECGVRRAVASSMIGSPGSRHGRCG